MMSRAWEGQPANRLAPAEIRWLGRNNVIFTMQWTVQTEARSSGRCPSPKWPHHCSYLPWVVERLFPSHPKKHCQKQKRHKRLSHLSHLSFFVGGRRVKDLDEDMLSFGYSAFVRTNRVLRTTKLTGRISRYEETTVSVWIRVLPPVAIGYIETRRERYPEPRHTRSFESLGNSGWC
jgi:hypothetical protein